MNYFLFFAWGILCFLFTEHADASPPEPPEHVQIYRQNGSFAVTWDVPAHAYGKLTRYVVSSVLLPEGNKTFLRLPASSPIAVVSWMDHLGKLFKIAVQAENQDGLSAPSTATYIRAPCGYKIFVPSGMTETLSSPKYPWRYESWVLCEWQVSTNKTHVISFEFEDVDFGGSKDCDTAEIYVTVRTKSQRVCSKRERLDVSESEAIVTFKSKRSIQGGKGFRIIITTREKAPGPPANVTLKSYPHSVHVNWRPPLENILPMTSYKLMYSILPSIKRVIILPARMMWFSINTKGYEGRLISVHLSAIRRELAGDTVGPFFVRAACQHDVIVSPGQIWNVTSPNYPHAYPPGIVCHWTLRTLQLSSELTLNVKWMDIQQTLLCSGDYLALSVGGNAHHCGYMKDHIIRTKNKEVNITMKTDYDDTRRTGFLIQVYLSGDVSTNPVITKSLTEQTTPSYYSTHSFHETKTITTSAIHLSSISNEMPHHISMKTAGTKTTNIVPYSSSSPLSSSLKKSSFTSFTSSSKLFPSTVSNVISPDSTSVSTTIHSSAKTTAFTERTNAAAAITGTANATTAITGAANATTAITGAANASTAIAETKQATEAIAKPTNDTTAITETTKATEAITEAANATTPTASLLSSSMVSTFRSTKSTTMFLSMHNTAQTRRFSNTPTPSPVDSNVTFYEPYLENSTIPVQIVFTCRRKHYDVGPKIHPLKKSVVEKSLLSIFKGSSLFCGLKVNISRSEDEEVYANVTATVTFNVEPVLQYATFRDTFRWISFLNETFIDDLSGMSLNDEQWEVDDESLRNFRSSQFFYDQEIQSKCDFVSTCSANYSCVVMEMATSGVVCCLSSIAKCSNACSSADFGGCHNKTGAPTNESIVHKEVKDDLIIILSVFSLSLFIVIIVIVIVSLKLRRMSKRKTMPVQKTCERVELHDILQSNFVGDKNIEFTAFTQKQKSGRLGEKFNGWSLPSRNILEKCKIPDVANGTTHNLKEYLQENGHVTLKSALNSLHRQHSL